MSKDIHSYLTKQTEHARLAHRNLLTMTARIKRTKMVMMAMVITRFVAILSPSQQTKTKPKKKRLTLSLWEQIGGQLKGRLYLRAIPRRVLTLLST